MAHLYDFQHRYVTALLKQLPPGTVYPAISRPVPMHPPRSIKSPPVRQGPFLLQPSPRTIDGSEGGDATDIAYVAFGSDVEEGVEGETERLGLVLAAFQDGRVDVYLDVEKVEARWVHKEVGRIPLSFPLSYLTKAFGVACRKRSSHARCVRDHRPGDHFYAAERINTRLPGAPQLN